VPVAAAPVPESEVATAALVPDPEDDDAGLVPDPEDDDAGLVPVPDPEAPTETEPAPVMVCDWDPAKEIEAVPLPDPVACWVPDVEIEEEGALVLVADLELVMVSLCVTLVTTKDPVMIVCTLQ